MNRDVLFNTFKLGNDLTLSNRIVMAPMNRSMADDDLVPTEAMVEYYGRRADTGLIITESLMISPSAMGYPNTPAIFTPAQIAGWKKVTRKVHENGGRIFAQIWHTGRVSHPIYLKGEQPLAPSAVALTGRVPRTDDLQYGMPREMTEAEIRQMIGDFAQAAANAREAGFDGVEVHAANGYLLDQFLHWDTNRRTDDWGGSEENMARILFEVLDAAKREIGQVGLRISPAAYIHLEHDARDKAVSDHVLQRLDQYDLAYVHTGMFEDSYQEHLAGTVTQYIRRHYSGTVIACGGYSVNSGREALASGDADLIAIGRPLIANPDFVARVRAEQPLTTYNPEMLNELV
ncbi:2,4-dienoyl-CoA reductase [Ferrimonas sediminum]|uniref:2,4-dienoyl-CoA reductase n=1 Tax=Ferrimonas sediminum TaxID=718193 RepID=A0A1G8RK13_9GAMM|nr:alkene reductase [Ferrimonas sediminum]SDJ17318.1 2,4-dienoyl-CoA reductase [Ferrimonas sediminum]